jgi:hypothetical protein
LSATLTDRCRRGFQASSQELPPRRARPLTSAPPDVHEAKSTVLALAINGKREPARQGSGGSLFISPGSPSAGTSWVEQYVPASDPCLRIVVILHGRQTALQPATRKTSLRRESPHPQRMAASAYGRIPPGAEAFMAGSELDETPGTAWIRKRGGLRLKLLDRSDC